MQGLFYIRPNKDLGLAIKKDTEYLVVDTLSENGNYRFLLVGEGGVFWTASYHECSFTRPFVPETPKPIVAPNLVDEPKPQIKGKK